MSVSETQKCMQSRRWSASCKLLAITAIFAGLFLIVSCGDDDKNPTGGTPGPTGNEVVDSLTFERQDGTTMSMGTDLAICCGIWESGHIDKNTLKILFYDSAMQESGWKLFILADEAVEDTSYTFPTLDEGQSPVSIFFFDLSTGNELSGDTDESSGTITINSFSCGPPVTIDLTIDAVIGSEFFQGPWVHITGTFKCTISDNPAFFGCDFAM